MNFSKFHIELNADLAWRLFLLFAAVCVIITSSNAAFAQAPAAADNDVVGQTLCRLVANLSGGIAAATAAGVGIIFSAPKLVAFLSGDADNANCDVGTTP